LAKWIAIFIAASFALRGASLSARGSDGGDTLDEQNRTSYLFCDYGLVTYKSKLVESNDTGSELGYGVGARIGEDKRWEVRLRKESSKIAFELNSSAIESSYQDILIGYRWGFVEIGANIATAAMIANAEGEALFDATGSGYGGHFAILMPVARFAIVKIEANTAAISTTIEKEQKDVGLGSRTDIELGANVDITKRYFDFIFGYRQRAHALKYLGSSFAEVRTATYLGLQLGVDF
jgi:hypothetical protein